MEGVLWAGWLEQQEWVRWEAGSSLELGAVAVAGAGAVAGAESPSSAAGAAVRSVGLMGGMCPEHWQAAAAQEAEVEEYVDLQHSAREDLWMDHTAVGSVSVQ